MANITYKNLFTQVDDLIQKRIKYNTASPYATQGVHNDAAPFIMQFGSGTTNVSASELISSIMTILQQVVPPNIVSGLEVTAETPLSAYVNVAAGSGTAGGNVYTLNENTRVQIPFDAAHSTFYINLYPSRIVVEPAANQLTIAKIIVPRPGITAYVQDTKDNSWNAYIQSFKEYHFYGFNDRFEEDTLELLRDNIGAVLADNLIGNIRLSENLKITNTAGTLELNSDKLLLKDFNQNILAKLNSQGIYFYNSSGVELARFTTNDAHIGNILITTNAIQSRNYAPLSMGFQIQDDGDAEFNQLTVRGTVYATAGSIGGWTIGNNQLYATTTGTIKTGLNVGLGSNGVIMDKDGIRVYDAILGLVANFPSDGSQPTISAGSIGGVKFEINTNTVIRTSETVGDGTAASAGILINNTGMYGCGVNQLLSDSNFKVLANGDAYFKGTISASYGQIGSVVITPTQLTGGLIVGAEIISPIIESSATLPRIRMDNNGMYYQVTTAVGQYDTFKYGDGTKYGSGVLAYLFNTRYPILSIMAEHSLADIRLYNRADDPGSGTGPHEYGDLICVNGAIKRCSVPGSPGTFTSISVSAFTDLTDAPHSYTGHSGQYVRVKADLTGLEFQTPAGGGDMLRATYDTNSNNIVDKSESIDDGAGNTATAANIKDAVAKKHAPGTTVQTVTQASHGFTVGQVLYYTGSAYALAKANAATTAEVVGVVSAVDSGSVFELTLAGYITGLSGLTAGSVYFLSDSTAGALTATEPSNEGSISKPLMIAISATEGYVVNMRGSEINATTNNLTAKYGSFTSADLQSGGTLLYVTHNFGHTHLVPMIYDNNNNIVNPTNFHAWDANTLQIDFSGMTVTGTWYYVLLDVGGSTLHAMTDADGDTKIELEKTVDDDTIRFSTIGVERMVLTSLLALSADKTSLSSSQANTHLSLRGLTTSTKELTLGVDTTNNYGFIQARDFGNAYYTLKLQPLGGSITVGTTGATIAEFSTDGTLAGNSDTALPTEQAVKTYVDGRRQEYTTGSGNWTCPTGVTKIWVTMCGGGAGGACSAAGGTNGAGGGGGGIIVKYSYTVVPGNTYAYSIGAGGAGAGAGVAALGSAGNDTTFGTGTVLTAKGGLAQEWTSAHATYQNNYPGGFGNNGKPGLSSGAQPSGGQGGSSLGSGGASSGANGIYGGGGAGNSVAGGTGGDGYILLEW